MGAPRASRRVQMRIPLEMLERMLDLPEGVQVRHIATEIEPYCLSLVLEGPNFPLVDDMVEAPRLWAETRVTTLEAGQTVFIRKFALPGAEVHATPIATIVEERGVAAQ